MASDNKYSSLYRLVLCAVLATVGLSTSRASAAEAGPGALPVTVLLAKSELALDQAEALTTVLRKAVRDSQGWSLAESKKSLEFLIVEMKCNEPIDAACQARIADVIKAERYVWATIDFDVNSKKRVKGFVNLWVRGRGTKRATVDYAANLTDPNDEALVAVAKKAFDEASGGPPKGTVHIDTNGVAGQVFVDGEPAGAVPAEGTNISLAAGEHRVEIRAPGYKDKAVNAVVHPQGTVEVKVAMELGAGSIPPLVEEKGVDGQFIAGIALMVVGGAGAVVGAIGGITALDAEGVIRDPNNGYLTDVPETEDACIYGSPVAALQEACSDADRGELMQGLGWGAAGLAGIAGLTLILTSETVSGGSDDDTVAFEIAPLISPTYQGVGLTGRF